METMLYKNVYLNEVSTIAGPYEKKVVLEQGSTPVNGPHQGALVDTPDGEWWFFHFQFVQPIGRVVHLQPPHWKDGWPVIGVDIDMNGSLDVVGTAVINSEQSLTGVFSNEENNNRFKKVGRTYNSDLNPDLERIIPIDFNMDGIPDFMGNTNKGNLFINEGSFDFTYSTETYTVPPKQSTYDKEITEYDLHDIYSRFDFDNDGYLDVAYGGFHYLRIGINRGDNLSFDRQTLPDPDSDDNIIWSMGQWIDFNRDGYMDFWYREADDAQRVTWRFIVYLNNGDGTFERKQVYETPYWDSDFSPFFFDLNNDGWQDIIWSVMPDYDGGVLETGSTHIVLGDASMSYVGREEIVLDGYAFNGEFFCYGCGHESRRLYDVDNNGWLDLPVMVADGFRTSASGYVSLQTATGLLYLYPDWETPAMPRLRPYTCATT